MKALFLLFILAPGLAQGQKSNFSFGMDVAIPNGALSTSAKTGLGFSFGFEYPFGDHLAGLATIGYISFGERRYPTNTSSGSIQIIQVTMLPIQVGVKYYFPSGEDVHTGIFAFGELGALLLTRKVTLNGVSDSPSESDVSFSLGAGYRLKGFELSYRQQFIAASGEGFNYSGLRIAFLLDRFYPPLRLPVDLK